MHCIANEEQSKVVFMEQLVKFFVFFVVVCVLQFMNDEEIETCKREKRETKIGLIYL